MTHFQAALQIDPGNLGTHYNLGLALEGLERPQEAMRHYQVVAEQDPNHPAAARLRALQTGG